MALLGQEYRLVYQALGFAQGLTGMRAYVLKPDDSLYGPMNLTELPGFFRGLYNADFLTSENDPEGDYLFTIISPAEGNRTTARVNFQRNRLPQIAARVNAIAESLVGAAATGYVQDSSDAIGVVTENVTLIGRVRQSNLSGTVQGNRLVGRTRGGPAAIGEVEDG